MKRFLMTCAVLVMAVVLCCTAVLAAQPESYYLGEMDADIALPSWDDYYFLYPDMSADNQDLEYLEMTPEDVNGLLLPGGILLDVLYYDFSHEFAVRVTEDSMSAEMFNYSELSQLEREIVLAAGATVFDGTGIELLKSGWVSAGDAVWMVLEYEVPGAVWCCQYSTVCNGKNLTIDAAMYLSYNDSEAMKEEIRSVAAMMADATVFHSIEDTPEGVGGITGKLITDVLAETGMETIDLTDVGLGTVDLTQVDLSGLDLNALVDALGLTEEEAVSLVRGELDPSQLDLSNAQPKAVLDALGMEKDTVLDIAMSALGLGDLDWRGIFQSAGRGALIGGSAAVLVTVLIIVLLAVCGRKKRGAAVSVPANEIRGPEEE